MSERENVSVVRARRRPLWPRRLWLVGIVVLCLLGTWFAFGPELKATSVQAAGRFLEAWVPRADLEQGAPITGIIVLGGYPGRIEAAIKLLKRFPGAKLVLSGPYQREIAIARAAVPARSLIIDRRARTTRQNALYSKELIKPKPEERWVLVTSALHMPRALASFAAVAFPVQPWPAYRANSALPASAKAIEHEVTGMFYYVLRGWIRPI